MMNKKHFLFLPLFLLLSICDISIAQTSDSLKTKTKNRVLSFTISGGINYSHQAEHNYSEDNIVSSAGPLIGHSYTNYSDHHFLSPTLGLDFTCRLSEIISLTMKFGCRSGGFRIKKDNSGYVYYQYLSSPQYKFDSEVRQSDNKYNEVLGGFGIKIYYGPYFIEPSFSLGYYNLRGTDHQTLSRDGSVFYEHYYTTDYKSFHLSPGISGGYELKLKKHALSFGFHYDKIYPFHFDKARSHKSNEGTIILNNFNLFLGWKL